MTTEEFANVGVFVTAFVGYLLGTTLFGCLGFDAGADDEIFYVLAWLFGAIIFATTVMVMRE